MLVMVDIGLVAFDMQLHPNILIKMDVPWQYAGSDPGATSGVIIIARPKMKIDLYSGIVVIPPWLGMPAMTTIGDRAMMRRVIDTADRD